MESLCSYWQECLFCFTSRMKLSLAFLRLRKQDFEGTQRWLNRIKIQANLVTKQQGYYHYLHGVIESALI